MASIDTNEIEKVMKLGPAYKAQYSYDDPESLRLIKDTDTLNNITAFYADPRLNDFMVSARGIQDLTNYS